MSVCADEDVSIDQANDLREIPLPSPVWRCHMSTFEKRAREDKRNDKARQKEQRRNEKRYQAPAAHEVISAHEVNGNVRSIEEVLQSLQGENRVQRSAPPIPSKLFVGSLSDHTTSAGLSAHFSAHVFAAALTRHLPRRARPADRTTWRPCSRARPGTGSVASRRRLRAS